MAFCAHAIQYRAPRAFYDQHRRRGDLHHQVMRAWATGLVGSCMDASRHHSTYDEHTA